MGKRSRGGMPVSGGSALLVIFAVLCLTVFALLSISTAQADARLSQASLEAIQHYYAADCRAEEILAQLRSGTVPSGVTVEGDRYRYSCPVTDRQTLLVEVCREADEWTVLRWQAVSTAEWEPDQTLEVWDGGDTED